MIKKLSDTYSYTPQEIKDKINQLIEHVNELDENRPYLEVVSLTNLTNYFNGLISKEDMLSYKFIARPLNPIK